MVIFRSQFLFVIVCNRSLFKNCICTNKILWIITLKVNTNYTHLHFIVEIAYAMHGVTLLTFFLLLINFIIII